MNSVACTVTQFTLNLCTRASPSSCPISYELRGKKQNETGIKDIHVRVRSHLRPVPSKSHGTSRNEVSPPSTTRTVSSLRISLPFHWCERPRPEATKSRQIALLTIKYSTFRGWNSYAITEAAPLAQLRRPTCSWKLIACHKTQRCVNLPSSATSMNNF